MSLHIEQVHWMPSPPLVPDRMPLDLAYLRSVTLGNSNLEQEVLALFAAQAGDLVSTLASLPPHAAEIAHTIKGSARSIGAVDLAQAAQELEGAMRRDAGVSEALRSLQISMDEVLSAIDVILHHT